MPETRFDCPPEPLLRRENCISKRPQGPEDNAAEPSRQEKMRFQSKEIREFSALFHEGIDPLAAAAPGVSS